MFYTCQSELYIKVYIAQVTQLNATFCLVFKVYILLKETESCNKYKMIV